MNWTVLICKILSLLHLGTLCQVWLWLSFDQTWIQFTQGCFVPSLVETGQGVLEEKMKTWKVYRQTNIQTDGHTDRWTDDRRSEKLIWTFSSGELKSKEKWNTHKLLLEKNIIIYTFIVMVIENLLNNLN